MHRCDSRSEAQEAGHELREDDKVCGGHTGEEKQHLDLGWG